MRLDLTHRMEEEMPVYPGTEKPIFDKSFTIEKNGFAETKVTMYSHTGTHMDAPAHMVPGGKTLDAYPIDHFIGRAYLVDLPNDLETLKKDEGLLKTADFVILRTGWSKYWGTPEYFSNFPVMDPEMLDYLLKFNIRGFGVDAISVDPVDTTTFERHMKIFEKDCTIVENLKGLDRIETSIFKITMLPLFTKDSDGFSARVVAESL